MNNLSHRQFPRQPTATPRIRVWRNGNEFCLKFQAEDYLFAELIGELKFVISAENRSYDATAKHWVVQAEGESELQEFITQAEEQYGALVVRWPGPNPNAATDKAVIQ